MDRDKRCPCCGQRIVEDVLPYGLVLRGNKLRIFEWVKKAGSNGIGSDVIINRLYENREDGGPLWPEKTLHVQMHLLNKALAPFNLKIRSNGSCRSSPGTYALVPL